MSLLKEIIKCQQEIIINQENHSVILNSLLRNHNINCQTTQLPDEITLLLPLQGLGAVEEFEVKLRDPDIFKAMVLYLSDQGGRSLVEAIGRMMEKLISNELARS
ncbi:uncharacterized protein LOC136079046 [Hydra vulgaris]|uniref:Uncharacterized protein LOC136079046 n=1 Tax=Hydra vulgaris TaxID=6087 RepID=A0ABM4BP17_HYDVU